MEVDRQPSPWPCVVMLVGLLLICMAVPWYWRIDGWQVDLPEMSVGSARVDGSGQAASDAGWPYAFDDAYLQFGLTGFRNRGFDVANGYGTENDLLSLLPAQTIEELISNRTGMPRHSEALFDWPAIVAPIREDHRPRPALVAAVPGPHVTAALETVGRALVQNSPVELVPQLSARVASSYRRWSAMNARQAALATPPTSTLRVRGPVIDSEPADEAPVTAQEPDVLSVPDASEPWCVPQVLFAQLQRLARQPYSARWATATIAQLRALTERDRLDGDDVHSILDALSDSTQAAIQMADETDDDRLRVELLRAHWALARRLDQWAVVHEIRVADRSRNRFASRGSLDSFRDGAPSGIAERPLTLALTSDLERYEQTRDPSLGRDVVREQRTLESSPDSLDQALADAVEQHYRNANVRVAITVDMLNRFAGQERSEVRSQRDRIAGTPVRSRSQTQSESHVRLDPATGRWQLDLEARGVVDSHSMADGGPAQLRSRSATDFAARKRIVVDSDGVLLQPASIEVVSRNRLVGVTTDYDWVPLFGSYARGRAAQEYRVRQARAKAEVESRVSANATAEIDRAAGDAVDRIERQFRNRFTDRLADAGIEVTPVEMTTTRERVVARLRVASDGQLGSHTPRPRALSDSLASVQVHETALTNAAVSLSLDGRRYTAAELQSLMREKFPRMAVSGTAVHRDTVFQFAAEDAMQFHFAEGRLEITLTLVSVEQDGRAMRDFVVHAYYAPVVNGLEAELVRDGALGIEGRFNSGQRARLHNIFNSVLAPERTLPIVRLDNPSDPRLAGLMVTQLVLEDGWLGLAVGPVSSERVAERSRSLR